MNKIIERSIEIRAVEESRTIEGVAVVFNSWSRDLGGFYEIIREGAITQDLVNQSDVICNINHDGNQLVARWNRGNGTLNLELKEDGLYFSFQAPETERGNELLWNIRHKNITECSFAFTLPLNDTCQRWYRENGDLKREILEIDGLYDVSIVNIAAYPATSVDNRNETIDIDMIIRSLDEKEAEEERALEEAKKAEIKEKLDGKLNDFYKNISL